MAVMQRWQAAVKATKLFIGSGGIVYAGLAAIAAAAAASATSAGSDATLTGGTGGTTSGAGGASKVIGGAALGGNSAGGEGDVVGGVGHGSSAGGPAKVTGGQGGATGAGGVASVTGGQGGATSGDGGAAQVNGGAAAAGNGNGGSVVLTGGAKNGSGIAGGIRVESVLIRNQPAPAAKTVSATLTAAEVLSRIITINQGAGATSAQQLPTGTALQAALPADFAVDDSFDVSVMNISTVDAEDASITTNTDMTLVGSMDFPAHSGITLASQGVLRFRKTADHVFSVYRIS